MSIPALASRIESVVVYRQGALVSRAAAVEHEAGGFPDEVRLANLPLALDDGSVRVRVEAADGASGALPAASELRVALDVPPGDPSLPPPKDEELEAARAEVLGLEDRVARACEAAERLEALAVKPRPRGPRGEPPKPSPTDARLALLDFRRRELLKLWDERQAREKELHASRDRLAELEFRWMLASASRQAREHELRKAVLVRLRPPDAGPAAPRCRIVAEYLVPGARWSPSYALRFEPDFSRARVSLRALVCQRSGEDWAGVRLALSTAEALAWTDLPELPSLRIGRRQAPPARRGFRDPPAGAEALFADYDRARAAGVPAAPQVRYAAAGEDGTPSDTLLVSEIRAKVDDLRKRMDQGDYFAACEDEAPPPPKADKKRKKGRPPAPEAAPAPEMSMPCEAPPPPPAPGAALRAFSALTPAGAAFGAGAPMASRSAAPSKKMKDMAALEREEDAAGCNAFAAPEEEPELTAPADLLAFGNLRLRGPDDSARGKLRSSAAAERYGEMLSALRVTAGGPVESWVRSAEASARSPEGLPLPAGHSAPESADGFDYAWRGETPVDVPADGAWHSVALAEAPAESALRHVAVPREDTNAFRFASFANPFRAPLLPGPADVYVGPDFALTAAMRTVAPQGNVDVGLGAEEGVKIARNTRYAEHTSGLLGGQLNLEHEITVEAANNLKRPVDLEVRERIPQPRTGDEQVQIEVLETVPKWEEWIQERSPVPGTRRWRVRIEPGAREVLKARYAVKIPAKKEIAGGNRREQ